MSNIKNSAYELIGRTPLLSLHNYQKKKGITGAEIVAKLEFLNPAGSVKDRVALEMIEDAEAKGILKPGATIIEPTSGNTGIGLASVAAAKGYKTLLTLPETMSVERRSLLAAYGAELVLTEGAKGMKGAIEKAEELRDSIPGSVIMGQFDNPANPMAHYKTTGPEIWEDTAGKLAIYVATVGTGGTLTGAGRFLKEKNPAIRVVAAEPDIRRALGRKARASRDPGDRRRIHSRDARHRYLRRGHQGAQRRCFCRRKSAGTVRRDPDRHLLGRSPLGGGAAGRQTGEQRQEDRRAASRFRRQISLHAAFQMRG